MVALAADGDEVASPDADGGVNPESELRVANRQSGSALWSTSASVCDDLGREREVARTNKGMSGSVLIVDDHDGFRLSVRRMLEREGYVVVGEAADGASGVEQAERLRPDIALVDIRLPDIDGFAVATAIRAAGSAKSILLISTRPRGDHGDRLLSSAADGFIEKSELSADTIAAIVGSRP